MAEECPEVLSFAPDVVAQVVRATGDTRENVVSTTTNVTNPESEA